MAHPTVLVQVGEMVADIDVELAPLITELWKAQLFTTRSCQELHFPITEYC
jgi:hypothetical protein